MTQIGKSRFTTKFCWVLSHANNATSQCCLPSCIWWLSLVIDNWVALLHSNIPFLHIPSNLEVPFQSCIIWFKLKTLAYLVLLDWPYEDTHQSCIIWRTTARKVLPPIYVSSTVEGSCRSSMPPCFQPFGPLGPGVNISSSSEPHIVHKNNQPSKKPVDVLAKYELTCKQHGHHCYAMDYLELEVLTYGLKLVCRIEFLKLKGESYTGVFAKSDSASWWGMLQRLRIPVNWATVTETSSSGFGPIALYGNDEICQTTWGIFSLSRSGKRSIHTAFGKNLTVNTFG